MTGIKQGKTSIVQPTIHSSQYIVACVVFRTIFPDRRNLRRICGAADVQDLRLSLTRLVDFRQRRKRE